MRKKESHSPKYPDKYQFNNNKFGAPNFGSNSFTETVNANREHGMSYDANGNILSLNRTNAAGSSTANFSYNYQSNTNKLSSVGGYATYNYDVLGQMSSQVRTASGQGYYVDYDVNGKVSAIYSDAAKTALRDAAIGRWMSTDPYQEFYSPYVGMGNNPVSSVDPDGGEVDPVVQLKQVNITAKRGFWSDFGKSLMKGAGNMFRHIYNNPNNAGYGYSPSMKAPNVSEFANYNVNWGNMIDPTHHAKSFAYDAVYGFTGVMSGDGARTAQALPAFVSSVAVVASLPRGVISELKIARRSTNVVKELPFSEGQVWKKFGEHYEEFGLQHGKNLKPGKEMYLKVAQDVYKNPGISHPFPQGGFYANETWLFGNGTILRLDPQGNFRSMYPILRKNDL